MPVTKQAAKKLRHDVERTAQNKKIRAAVAQSVKKARRSPSQKTLAVAFRTLDKAAKHHIVHKNTAARLKSRLTKLLKK